MKKSIQYFINKFYVDDMLKLYFKYVGLNKTSKLI